VNEGGFQQGNASLGFLDLDEQDYEGYQFSEITGNPLGDVFHSIYLEDELGYLVINNSSKIEVLDLSTLDYVGSIEGLGSPRYMISRESEAFVSTLFENKIFVVNTESREIERELEFPGWSEQMIWHGDQLMVSCPDCEYTYLVDPLTAELTDSLFTGKSGSFLRKMPDGNILSFASGSFDGTQPPELRLFSTELELIDSRVIDGSSHVGAFDLSRNSDKFFFADTDIKYIALQQGGLGDITTAFSPAEGISFYKLTTGPNDEIFLSNARDFSSIGEVLVYSSDGQLLYSFEAGVVPSDLYLY
jgi:hypothetical protein